jgi:hypothetical protein
MCRQRSTRRSAFHRYAWTLVVALFSLVWTSEPKGQDVQDGVFLPAPRRIETAAPIPTIHPLVNESVSVEAGSPPKEIVRDVKKVQTDHRKSNRLERWLTVAGLGGIVAAFLFGQVGGY